MGKKFIQLGQDKSFEKSFSNLSFVAIFGTSIDANLSKNYVILGFGELFKMFKNLRTNNEKITNISKTPEIGSRFVRVKC